MRDSRSDCSAMIPRRRSGRSCPSWSAYARMLVSGVWRLWLTPRRKSSFAASSSRSWAFCASTWANSSALRIATATSLANRSSRSWSARSQRRVAGSRPTRTPSSLAAGAQDRPQRAATRRARPPRSGMVDGSPRQTSASIIPNAIRASSAARAARKSTPSRGDAALDRRKDPAQLPVAALEVRGQAVVALGEPRELVVAGHADRGRRSPADTRSTAAAIVRRGRGQVGHERVGREDRERDHDREREQEETPEVRVGPLVAAAEDEEQDPEAGEGQDRRRDQGDRQPRAKPEPRAFGPVRRGRPGERPPRLVSCVVEHRRQPPPLASEGPRPSTTSPPRAGSRRRGP